MSVSVFVSVFVLLFVFGQEAGAPSCCITLIIKDVVVYVCVCVCTCV